MTVDLEGVIREFVWDGEVDHVVGVEFEWANYWPNWTVRVRRDRPVHVTIGRGGTPREALDDVKRMLRS